MHELSFIRYTPIYMSVDEATQPIENLSPQPIQNPGKIHYHRNFLLINEERKGIHIIDNLDPNGPQNLGFISIPGNIDLITKNDILYADSYQDLLIIDINNPFAATIVERRTAFFQFDKNENGDLVVDYSISSQLADEPCDLADAGWSIDEVRSHPDGSFDAVGEHVAGVQRLRGILSVENYFGRYEQALYISTPNDIRILDISDETNPSQVNTLTPDTDDIWGEAQISNFHAGEGILLAATAGGVHIYDNTLSAQPELLDVFGSSDFSNSCRWMLTSWQQEGYFVLEPCSHQIVSNPITIRNVEWNAAFLINVDAFRIADPPRNITAYGELIYAADEDNGLHIFDMTMTDNILNPLNTINHPANDVLILPAEFCSTGRDALIVTGENAIYQYDLSNPFAPPELSQIPIEQ